MNTIVRGIGEGFRGGTQLAAIVAFALPAKLIQIFYVVIRAYVTRQNFEIEHVEAVLVLRRIEKEARAQHKENDAQAAASLLKNEPIEARSCA